MSKWNPSTGQEPGSGPSGSGNDAPKKNYRGAIGVAVAIAAALIVLLTMKGC